MALYVTAARSIAGKSPVLAPVMLRFLLYYKTNLWMICIKRYNNVLKAPNKTRFCLLLMFCFFFIFIPFLDANRGTRKG